MHFRKEFLPYFLIIGFVFVIIISAFYFSFSKTNQPSPRPSVSPKKPIVSFSPRPEDIDSQNLQYHPNDNTVAQTTDQQSQEMIDKDTAIGNILPKLPYKGNFFSLEYDYQINSFTLTLSASNKSQANQEFDEFLKNNHIENRNWLYNLKIVNK